MATQWRQADTSLLIRWHTSADAIPDEAWSACFPAPLEGRWWYLALERAGLEDQFSFGYASLERGGKIVGIMPTFRMDVPLRIVAPEALWPLLSFVGRLYPPLLVQPTLFVGSPCAEHGTVGLRLATELGSVLPALQAELDRRARHLGARMIVWKDLPEPPARALRKFAPTAGLFEVTSFPGTVVHLPDGGYENYLASLPGRRRYRLRKKLKRSHAAVCISARDVRKPDAETIEHIHRLYLLNLERASVRFERLTKAFFEQIASCDTARFLLLIDDVTRTPAAFMLYFVVGDVFINKFVGIDLDVHPDAYLYFRLWEAFAQRAAAHGATTISSGQTGYRPKLELGHHLVPLSNFTKHFNPVLHAVYAAVGRRVTLATLDPELARISGSEPAHTEDDS